MLILTIAIIILIIANIGLAFLHVKNHQATSVDELKTRLTMLQEQFGTLQSQLSGQIITAFNQLRGQVIDTLKQNAEQTDKQVALLTKQTDDRLKEISGQVEKRLSEGFEKTTATFQDILQRLVIIDKAQKQIAELSSNVVSLQAVLTDKRSRGAFGEVQLSALIKNILPENSYKLQYTFSNGVRVDCALFLPEPSGVISIDAKFPLENYQKMIKPESSELEQQQARRLFKQDIKKHIQDIASKYIIPNQTTDGAIMFIPAEAVFAEIHAHHTDIVELAQRSRVWLTSPTTLMAVLTTAHAVIKDHATRKQVHIIQSELNMLSKDFNRFHERFDKLAKSIERAHRDVDDVHISAKKLTTRFQRIEKVELDDDDTKLLDQ